MSDGPAWINGTLGGAVDPRDRGLTLGDGVFDTLVAFRRVPFAGGQHLKRLLSQSAAIGIDVDPMQVRAGWTAVLSEADAAHVILRTTVTRGPSGRGLWPRPAANPTIIVSAASWEPSSFAAPLRLATSPITRYPGSPSANLKALGYLDNVLAAREAWERGADDALLLTPSGSVACTTIANVFVVTGNRLVTPPLTDAVQPGIMRRLVLDAATHAGLIPEEASLIPKQLHTADLVFATNSVRFLSPCTELDGDALSNRGAEKLAALTGAVCAQVLESCGFDPRRSSESRSAEPLRRTRVRHP